MKHGILFIRKISRAPFATTVYNMLLPIAWGIYAIQFVVLSLRNNLTCL